jgi:hypothetical protein
MNDAHARIAAKAIGAIFLSGFGALWLAIPTLYLFDHPFVPLLVIGAAAGALLFTARQRLRGSAEHRHRWMRSPAGRHFARGMRWINLGQWAAIVAAGLLLAWFDAGRWMLDAVMAIVGLHFLPLARVTGNRSDLVTGAALVLIAATYPFLFAEGPQSPWGAVAAGIVLWLAALERLAAGPRAAA